MLSQIPFEMSKLSIQYIEDMGLSGKMFGLYYNS